MNTLVLYGHVEKLEGLLQLFYRNESFFQMDLNRVGIVLGDDDNLTKFRQFFFSIL